jgi:uncharacterized protein YfaS (alpha-2-macroglobulin family)
MSVASTPAGRGRFWTVVFCFAVVNLLAWVGYHRWIASRLDVLKIENAWPQNNDVVDTRTALTWKFNLDVAPTTGAVGVVNPKIDGEWKWSDARTLAFIPNAPLPKATEISITLQPEHFRTPQGLALTKSFNTRFRTTPLSLVSARQIGFGDAGQVIIGLEFDDSVSADQVLKHVSLSAENREVRASLYGSPEGKVVRLITDLSTRDTRIENLKLHLEPGLSGASGPLAMEATLDRTIALARTLDATHLEAQSPGDEQARLILSFNGPVDPTVLRAQLKIDPETKYTIANSYDGVALSGDFKPATRYTLILAPPPAGSDPTRYPKAGVLSVFVPDKTPSVWLEHDEGYLGSKGNRTVLAHAVNVPGVNVEIYRVYDNNLVNWRNREGRSYDRELDNYAKPVATKTITLSGARNKQEDVRIALDELVPDGARDGVYQIQLSFENKEENSRYYYYRNRASAIVTLSDIGLVAKTTHDGACVWAVSLADAKPLEGVRVRLFSSKNQPLGEANTDANGIARLTHGKLAEGESPAVVLADRLNGSVTTHLTWLDLRSSGVSFAEDSVAGNAYLREGHEAFLYTDRGVYRPGETVYLRGIVRAAGGTTPKPFPVKWQILRPDLRNWKSQVSKLNEDGSSEWIITLPSDLPTGRWSASLALPGENTDAFGKVSFQVEEFIPDRIKVIVSLPQVKANRLNAGETDLKALVQADYLFGQPAQNLQSNLVARLDATKFAPTQWSNWTFGDDAGVASELKLQRFAGRRLELDESATNERGSAEFPIPFDMLLHAKTKEGDTEPTDVRAYAGPWKLTISASVSEHGGRAITAVQSVDVDRLSHYIAVEKTSGLIRTGTENLIRVALVKPDGSPASEQAKLEYQVFRESWNSNLVEKDGRYRYESTRVLDAVDAPRPLAVARGRGEIQLTIEDGGEYILVVSEPEAGAITTQRIIVGNSSWADTISRENPEKLEVTVVPFSARDMLMNLASPLGESRVGMAMRKLSTYLPEQTTLRAGTAAIAIVRAPFAGQLLLSVETDDVIRTQVVAMNKSSIAVPIQLEESMRPNAYVTASVVRNIDPNARWRIHRAVGITRVSLDNSDRKLNVEFAAPTELRPMRSLSALVRVTDETGRPVPNASLTVAAVDEGICSLTRFKTPDPFDFFYGARALGVETADIYSQLMPEVARPDKQSVVGGDGAEDGYDPRHQSPVSAKRVKPVSLVSAILHTDEQGVAKFGASVPEFTGQLRLMGTAQAKDRYGAGESKVFIRSPLLVQTSWPRFAAPGDAFSVSFTVFNHSDAAGAASVTFQTSEGSPVSFEQGKTSIEIGPIFVKGNGQATGSLPVRILQTAGIARIKLLATLNDETYEESIELPVRPASPAITTGEYLSAKPDAPLALRLPGDLMPGTVDWSIRVSSFPNLRLPDGLDYLERYPYGCAEQTTSTLFPLVYLNDIGDRIGPGVFAKERIAEKVNAGITRLIGMQTRDGGLAMWPGLRDTWPWGSVYAAHFIVTAERAGYSVPTDFRDRLMEYLRDQLHRSDDQPWALELQAYACYVVALAGEPQTPVMNRLGELLARSKDASAQARFHLAAAWLAAGRRDLAEELLPAQLPKPRGSRELAGNVGSPIRDRAIILDTLLSVAPDRSEIPALAQELADSGSSNGWRSTQETAFAVMALGKYIRTVKPTAAFDLAELLAGDRTLAKGATIDWSGKTSESNLQLKLSGAADAKGYVALLASGVPTKTPEPADHGIQIRRRLLDRSGKEVNDTVRSGELVQVELSVQSSSSIANLVIEDLLPAGLEIENPRLEGTADSASVDTVKTKQPRFTPDRTDIRDDRLVLFGNIDAAGKATYTYLARAVTPGEYVLPPARVECMYDLGISSISESGKLVVSPLKSAGLVDTGHE